jgi:hypothetical protein
MRCCNHGPAVPWKECDVTTQDVDTQEVDAEAAASVAAMRAEVAALHGELVRSGLVVWTAGNVSGRVPGADLFQPQVR